MACHTACVTLLMLRQSSESRRSSNHVTKQTRHFALKLAIMPPYRACTSLVVLGKLKTTFVFSILNQRSLKPSTCHEHAVHPSGITWVELLSSNNHAGLSVPRTWREADAAAGHWHGCRMIFFVSYFRHMQRAAVDGVSLSFNSSVAHSRTSWYFFEGFLTEYSTIFAFCIWVIRTRLSLVLSNPMCESDPLAYAGRSVGTCSMTLGSAWDGSEPFGSICDMHLHLGNTCEWAAVDRDWNCSNTVARNKTNRRVK